MVSRDKKARKWNWIKVIAQLNAVPAAFGDGCSYAASFDRLRSDMHRPIWPPCRQYRTGTIPDPPC